MYYFAATAATNKNIYTYKSKFYKAIETYRGGEGGVKKSFFSFQK
jgi:hypothetical protein